MSKEMESCARKLRQRWRCHCADEGQPRDCSLKIDPEAVKERCGDAAGQIVAALTKPTAKWMSDEGKAGRDAATRWEACWDELFLSSQFSIADFQLTMCDFAIGDRHIDSFKENDC